MPTRPRPAIPASSAVAATGTAWTRASKCPDKAMWKWLHPKGCAARLLTMPWQQQSARPSRPG
eukprot:4004820-Alexandrium_andersonii.AAC.1